MHFVVKATPINYIDGKQHITKLKAVELSEPITQGHRRRKGGARGLKPPSERNRSVNIDRYTLIEQSPTL